jgi:hypothetical protein
VEAVRLRPPCSQLFFCGQPEMQAVRKTMINGADSGRRLIISLFLFSLLQVFVFSAGQQRGYFRHFYKAFLLSRFPLNFQKDDILEVISLAGHCILILTKEGEKKIPFDRKVVSSSSSSDKMKENWKRDDNPNANNNNAHEPRSTFMSPHRAAEAVTSILKPRGHRRSSSNTSPVAILLPTPSNNNSSPTLAGLSLLPQNASHGRNALVISTPALEQLSPSPATTHNPLAYSTPAYHQAPYAPSSSPSPSSWETGVSKPPSTPSSVGYSSTESGITTQRVGLQSRKFGKGSNMAASFAIPSTSSNPNQLEKPRTRAEFEPKEFFDAIARALLSPSEPIYFFFCILLLLFLFVCCHFFGILLVWGTTLLFLYIISMHQSQESRDIFYKNWLQFHPKENVSLLSPSLPSSSVFPFFLCSLAFLFPLLLPLSHQLFENK